MKEKKKINGNTIRKFFGYLIAFSGFCGIMSGDFLAGIFMLLFGISLLPILYKKLEENEKFENYKKFKLHIILPIILLFITGAVLPPSEETTQTSQLNNVQNSIVNEVVNEISNEINNTTVENTVNNEVSNNVVSENTVVKNEVEDNKVQKEEQEKIDVQASKTSALSNIPAYSNKAYVSINNNKPFFTSEDVTTTSYEKYSNLDNLKRCGVAIACVGKDLMPTEERGNIGSVKPTGWHTVKYKGIDGNYLYNRCHLIGFQLSGENANDKNLITGTRYMNVDGMLPFENMIADYVKETNNHVLYRVTPIFEGNNLLASGVLLEAKSVEDNGAGVEFCVYCYNVQPGIEINYSNGESKGPEFTGSESAKTETNKTTTTTETKKETESTPTPAPAPSKPVQQQPTTNDVSASYVLNTNTRKFHYPSCGSAGRISAKNRSEYNGSRADLIAQGYSPCGNCDP